MLLNSPIVKLRVQALEVIKLLILKLKMLPLRHIS
jgi:hypothetical protein